MARKIGERLRELRKIVRLHMNWFTVALLGSDAVEEGELQELAGYGKLSLGDSLELAKKSYILGRLQATLPSSAYKKLSYEAAEEATASAQFTQLEEYAIEHIKLAAINGLKSLVTVVSTGTFDRLGRAVNSTMSAASVQGVDTLEDIEKKPYQKVVSSLAQELKAASSALCKRIVSTEMHRAKQVGTSQAIVNKLGPYAASEGPDSLVHILPNIDTCTDCADHYLDSAGEPRSFRLSAILLAGSNADAGVSHTRKGGKHAGWKTTLPPLHPGCGCRVVYAAGGLLRKAIGDAATGSVEAPKPPSIPGVAAPGNVAGPGAPSGTAKTELADTEGPAKQMVDCPFGGGEECKKHGGNGYKQHEAGGAVMRAHQEHLDAGAKATDPAAAAAMMVEERSKADAYSAYPPADKAVLNDIGSGEVIEVINTKEGIGSNPDEIMDARNKGITGLTDSFWARIKDNGWAMMKPGASTERGRKITPGLGDLGQGPADSAHKHEAAMYDYSVMLGSNNSVPPTTTRTHEGTGMSMQAKIDGFTTMGVHLKGSGAHAAGGSNYYKAILKSAPKDKKESVKRKVDEIISMTIASNAGDDHVDNWMISEDFSDVRKIDNGASFSNSMYGSKNQMLREAARASSDGLFHMPEHVTSRMSTMSLDDMKKGLGNLQDWQVGQQFMRQQYMLHLQEEHGGISPEYFLPTMAGEGGAHPGGVMAGAWGNGVDAAMGKFYAREAAGQLPHQMFESFSKAWLADVSKDDKHPHNAAAVELNDLGVFMPPSYKVLEGDTQQTLTMANPDEARRRGEHVKYADKVVDGYPPKPGSLTGGGEDMLAQLRAQQDVKPVAAKDARTQPASGDEKTGPAAKVSKSVHLYLDLTKGW